MIRKTVTLVLLLAVLALAFIPTQQGFHPVLMRQAMDAMHLPAGLFFVIAFYQFRRSIPLALFLSLVMILAIEYVQPLFGRESSDSDIETGLLGIMLGGVLLFSHVQKNRWIFAVVALLTAAAIALVMIPPYRLYQKIEAMHVLHPVLGNFNDNNHDALWRPFDDERLALVPRATKGDWALRVDVGGSGWPGIVYSTLEKDWSGYGQLCFESRATTPGTGLLVRLKDSPANSKREGTITAVTLSDRWQNYCLQVDEQKTRDGRRVMRKGVLHVFFVVEGKMDGNQLYLDNVVLRR